MLKAVVKDDKYGRKQTNYILTQGDSCTIYARPYKDGALLPVDQVVKCVFKLSDSDYKQEFSKDLVLEGDKFVLRLGTEETSLFVVDKHIYEIEYTLTGGEVQTPNQGEFEIIDQIKL